MIRRRFVNIVAESCKTGMYSVHRLDATKHLLYPLRAQAQALVPLVWSSQKLVVVVVMMISQQQTLLIERLQELPAPCLKIHPCIRARWPKPSLAFFGDGLLYDADAQSTDPMPPRIDGEEEEEEAELLHVIHKAPDRHDRLISRTCVVNATI